MLSSDRRLGVRVPVELFLNQYLADRPSRVLGTSVSQTGIYVNRVRLPSPAAPRGPSRVVGLEFELPGTGEIIWARGEICTERLGADVVGTGIRFTGMPLVHARLIRDFCAETRRAELARLLARVRRPPRPRGRSPAARAARAHPLPAPA